MEEESPVDGMGDTVKDEGARTKVFPTCSTWESAMFPERAKERFGLKGVMDAGEMLQNKNDGVDFGSRTWWTSRLLISNFLGGQ